MEPRPCYIDPGYRGSGKLAGKVALITGGDSGIGRAVAVHFAAEGANVVINFLSGNETADVEETLAAIRAQGADGLAVQGDVSKEEVCIQLVARCLAHFGRLDILVNNAAQQTPSASIADISAEQLERTFRTNLFSAFFLVKAALPHLGSGARIINTTSLTAQVGNGMLIDYASSKGALEAFTVSLSAALLEKGIFVNAVAPGPIWTPLVASSFDREALQEFGRDVPMGRPGQPSEVAPAYVYLASGDSSYLTGQVLHPNGGWVTGS